MSNTTRIIEELISLEAWFNPFEVNIVSPLFIAIGFSDARYAGDEKTLIEFKVELKRATLVIVCDENIQVPKATKVREHPKRERDVRTMEAQGRSSTKSDETSVSLKAGASLTSFSVGVEAADKQAVENNKSNDTQKEISERFKQTVHMTYSEVGNEHHWNCAPMINETLVGNAHDGTSPIIEMKALTKDRLKDLGIRVFLKCKAEDFEISEMELKTNFKEKLLGKDVDRRMRMAKEVIKIKLSEAELEVTGLDSKFQEVILADIMATPE